MDTGAPGALAARPLSWARGWAVLLVSALAAVCPQTAQSQTATTLVSNVARVHGGHRLISEIAPRAQPFGTGSESIGYVLTGIVLDFAVRPTGTAPLTVSIRRDSAGSPGAADLYTMTHPASLSAGLNEFAAPGGAKLCGRSKYWVMLAYDGPATVPTQNGNGTADAGAPRWRQTLLSEGLDPGAAAGWNIGEPYKRSRGSSWIAETRRYAMKIRVKGTVAGFGTDGAATGAPTISGTAQVGRTLSASTSGIEDPDGLNAAIFRYQWVRVDADGTSNPTDIDGATSRSYTLVEADRGRKIRVRVGFRDDQCGPASLTSDATDTVVPGMARIVDPDERPDRPEPPRVTAIRGTATQLSATWSAPDRNGGPPLIGYDLQFREGTAGRWADHAHDGTRTRTTIGRLAPGTLYQVRVRARNGVRPSEWSPPGAGRTNSPDRIDDRMLRPWLARFARTAARQVGDAVEDRIASLPVPGFEESPGGERVGSRGPDNAEDGATGVAFRPWRVTEGGLLLGSSFTLGARTPDGGSAGLGVRAAVSSFDGRESGAAIEGRVSSLMMGADWRQEAFTAGLLLVRTRGEGGYRGDGRGKLTSRLTGFYPYSRYRPNEWVTLWGVAGYGRGKLTLKPQGDRAVGTDLGLAMAAAGMRGVVLSERASGGMEIAVKSDALAVLATSARSGNLAATKAEVTLLRLGVEWALRGIRTRGEGKLTPRLEVGMRYDRGDAETGFGSEFDAGLAWRFPRIGLAAEANAGAFLTHQSGRILERGLSWSVAWNQRPQSGRGVSLTLAQSTGAPVGNRAAALLERDTPAGPAANELGQRRLSFRLGYGFAAPGNRFTATPGLGFALSNGRREYILDWQFTPAQRGAIPFDLGLTATRRDPADNYGAPEHRLMLSGSGRW